MASGACFLVSNIIWVRASRVFVEACVMPLLEAVVTGVNNHRKRAEEGFVLFQVFSSPAASPPNNHVEHSEELKRFVGSKLGVGTVAALRSAPVPL